MARTISGGDLFAPKGGFSCLAFNSLPHSLEFDLFDPDPAKTSWHQMYSEYDGIDLSPLASSYQIPPLGAMVRSPIASINTTVAGINTTVAGAPRGWVADGGQEPGPGQPGRPREYDRHRRLSKQHQQQQQQQQARQDSAAEKGDESDYTTPSTVPSPACKPTGLLRTASQVETPVTGSEESIWDRAFSAGKLMMMESTKRARSVALPQRPTVTTAPQEIKRPKKRRVVTKDPDKPKPKPWSESELAQFRQLVKTEGPNNWAAKAEKLGTNRSAKSLHTRWLREEGRIVDRPRGAAATTDP